MAVSNVGTIVSTGTAAAFAWEFGRAKALRRRSFRGFHSGEAGFGFAPSATGFPLIMEDDGQDTAGEGDGDRIGADEGPSHCRKAICEPQRYAAGEHHIHGQGEPVRLARADHHDRLGQERGRGEEGGDKADEFYAHKVRRRHCIVRKVFGFMSKLTELCDETITASFRFCKMALQKCGTST